MNSLHLMRLLAVSGALLLGAVTAQAAVLKYDFAVTVDGSGDVYTGNLEFDDGVGAAPFALTSFSFDFIDATGAAMTYMLGDLAFSEADVDAGNFAGINADEQNSFFAFVSAVPVGPSTFSFDFAGGNGGDGTGTVEYRQVINPMSAPASLALALTGLALLGARRRAAHAN